MLNKVMVIGNLGRDPEVRSTPAGHSVASFSVATTRRYTTKAGEKREETEWYNVEGWGKLAEICARYLKKGSKVYVEGRGQTDQWDDKDTGQKRYKFKVVLDEMKMLDPKGSNDGGSQSDPFGDDDGEIPF